MTSARGKGSTRQPAAMRLDKQRARQRALRAKAKATKRPSRDDVARVLLFHVFTRAVKANDEKGTDDLLNMLAKRLVAQGFDRDQSDQVLDALMERYKRGWGFLRKTHLMPELLDDPEARAIVEDLAREGEKARQNRERAQERDR